MCMSLIILLGFYVHSFNSGIQVALSIEKGEGDAIDYVDSYIGKKIDMPVVAYGFVLGYAIKSFQSVQSESLPAYDDGYIWGFVDTWTQEKLVPTSQAFGDDQFGEGYDDGSSEACVIIFANPDYNDHTKQYVKQVEDCL